MRAQGNSTARRIRKLRSRYLETNLQRSLSQTLDYHCSQPDMAERDCPILA